MYQSRRAPSALVRRIQPKRDHINSYFLNLFFFDSFRHLHFVSDCLFPALRLPLVSLQKIWDSTQNIRRFLRNTVWNRNLTLCRCFFIAELQEQDKSHQTNIRSLTWLLFLSFPSLRSEIEDTLPLSVCYYPSLLSITGTDKNQISLQQN